MHNVDVEHEAFRNTAWDGFCAGIRTGRRAYVTLRHWCNALKSQG
jgi:hypothetical protein